MMELETRSDFLQDEEGKESQGIVFEVITYE
jgi:hypothetical protein